jgi:hypothetical protein
VSSSPRSPSEHYEQGERLQTVAERLSIDLSLRDLSALLVVGHALLALAPRRGSRAAGPPDRHTDGNGLPPHLSWGDGR